MDLALVGERAGEMPVPGDTLARGAATDDPHLTRANLRTHSWPAARTRTR